ncbi:phosphoglycolate phosphatase-like HAD superfamily hydrolase [Conyzicola lurida]|uniref:Phosphoglycolate phosphatase-like HAD superfamily hydrolase n=1 Tax=Conyzicola lurida TaxID=1172621 RepID=A0A841AMI0_9MICO|nr:HAD family hydrolase [Conyzicola lurida]MBB5842629.1 phosphoglycolate phosphatase-like HAD superfamily hydrolase [Conyzicola lurida]
MTELPSWRDGAARSAIVSFVEGVVAHGLPPVERVAVFDNDGTLWTEKPMPTQLHFLVQQWAAAARADPTLADIQPYKAVVMNDLGWMGSAVDKHYAGDDSDLGVIIAAILRSTEGVSVDDYEESVAAFYRDAQHLTLKRPYSGAVFQPMIELLRYLEGNGFTCYIVSGGERDFMRPMTLDYYGIPPERVVGSAFGLEYADGEVRYGKSLSFFDDGPEKPVRVWSRIGRRPILAAGNSNGDLEMLEYAAGNNGLGLLVRHDDDTGRGDPPYDRGAERALERAAAGEFTVVSVKDDWDVVFPE